MKNDELNILKSLKNVRLSTENKEAIKNKLIAQIDVPKYSFMWSHSIKTAFATVLVTISLGSTIVFAAEKALPGDFLYPVKTKINENIERVIVTSSPVSQAKFETKLVEKRLKEAEELTKDKDLEEPKKDIIKKEIERQTEKAEEAIFKAKEIEKNKKIKDKEEKIENKYTDVNREKIEDKKQEDREDKKKKDEEKNNEDRNDNRDKDRDNKDKDDDDEESELDRVYKKHEDVVKKLDINKKSRSGKN